MLGTCSMSKTWLIFLWSPSNNQRKDSPFLRVSLMLGVSCEVGCPHQHLYLHQQGATLWALLWHIPHLHTQGQHRPTSNSWTSAFITDKYHTPWVPLAICEPHYMETQEYCRARAPVAGRVQLQQIYKVPPLWHVALGMVLSSHGRIVLQHLSFGFQRDMSSPM